MTTDWTIFLTQLGTDNKISFFVHHISIFGGYTYKFISSHYKSRKHTFYLDIPRDIYEDKDSETLYDRDLCSARSTRREKYRSVMPSGFSLRRYLYRETHLSGFAFGEREVSVFYTDPVRETVYIGSLILRFDKGRGTGIVSGDEILFGSIEGNRRGRIVGDLDDLGFFLTGSDSEFVFERRDREACLSKGDSGTEECDHTQNSGKLHRRGINKNRLRKIYAFPE